MSERKWNWHVPFFKTLVLPSWHKAFVRNIYHLLLVALGTGSILMLSGNAEANGLAVVIDVKNTPVSVHP